MGPTQEAVALADFLISRFGLTIDRYLLAYATMEYIELEFGAELDAEDATTPQPDAEALRELVQRWRNEAGDWDVGSTRAAYNRCADGIESLLTSPTTGADGESLVGRGG